MMSAATFIITDTFFLDQQLSVIKLLNYSKKSDDAVLSKGQWHGKLYRNEEGMHCVTKIVQHFFHHLLLD